MRPWIMIVSAVALFAPVAAATAQTFEKKHYNYSEWAKGRFSEAVTVTGPGKTIFLAGVGAEDENGKAGDILHKGDVTAQCKYAFEKIKRALEKNGATLADIAKMVTTSPTPDISRISASAGPRCSARRRCPPIRC